MEVPNWLEPCEHTDCTPRRLEYCAQEPANSPDEVVHITELVEDMLVQIRLGDSITTYKSSEDGESERARVFTVRDVADNEHQLLNSQHHVIVRVEHLKNPTRTVYTIADEWKLASEDELSEPITRLYTLETYQVGTAHLIVTEGSDIRPDVPVRVYEDRPMTPYDMNQLYELLAQVEEQYATRASA